MLFLLKMRIKKNAELAVTWEREMVKSFTCSTLGAGLGSAMLMPRGSSVKFEELRAEKEPI